MIKKILEFIYDIDLIYEIIFICLVYAFLIMYFIKVDTSTGLINGVELMTI